MPRLSGAACSAKSFLHICHTQERIKELRREASDEKRATKAGTFMLFEHLSSIVIIATISCEVRCVFSCSPSGSEFESGHRKFESK